MHVAQEDKYNRLLAELDKRQGLHHAYSSKPSTAQRKRLAKASVTSAIDADAIHGNLHQNKRERVIDAFREQRYRILVATDIAARGLDINHIEHVINYDLPQVPEDYIHRIRRTARADASGSAINLISPDDARKWREIMRFMNPQAAHSGAPAGDSNAHKPQRPPEAVSFS